MAKRMKLVDPSKSHASKSVAIQWELSIQQRKTAQGEVTYAGYRTLAENVTEFNRLGLISKTMNFDSFDE